MTDRPDDLVIPMLRAIQAEQTAARERDREIITRLANLETALTRVERAGADNYAEIIETRHSMDRMRERLERIEHRLDIADA